MTPSVFDDEDDHNEPEESSQLSWESLSQSSHSVDPNSHQAPVRVSQPPEITADEVIRRIEEFSQEFIEALDDESQPFPALQTYVDPHDDDDEHGKAICKRFTALHQARSYTSIWMVLSFCHQLLLSNRTATNREVYYHYVTHFRNQKECDAAIFDVAVLLQVPRHSLGLKASPKGWFCGIFQLVRGGEVICDGRKLSSHGSPITSEWLMGLNRRSFSVQTTQNCICILVIEKEGVFNRLAEDRFFDDYPCIIVCGKGFPDLATRACVHALHTELDLPVWGVADCDPYGMLVLHCYMYSNNTQLGVDGGSRYGVPIKWVGLRPSQIDSIQTDESELPEQCFMRLTEHDRKRLEDTLLREDHRWTNFGEDERRIDEIEKMLDVGYKVELEAFNWMGMHFFSDWLGKIFEKNLQDEDDLAAQDDDEDSSSGDLAWMDII